MIIDVAGVPNPLVAILGSLDMPRVHVNRGARSQRLWELILLTRPGDADHPTLGKGQDFLRVKIPLLDAFWKILF